MCRPVNYHCLSPATDHGSYWCQGNHCDWLLSLANDPFELDMKLSSDSKNLALVPGLVLITPIAYHNKSKLKHVTRDRLEKRHAARSAFDS